MADRKTEIEELKKIIAQAEQSLAAAKEALSELTGENYHSAAPSKASAPVEATGGKIVEGIFDGEGMLGPDGKIYPVPANYASKSKLVEGDRLKLTIAEDGSFIFKQIGPTERKKLIGTLNFENNLYSVAAEGKNYHVLYASVTYFKAKPGERVTIVVPAAEEAKWAAIENIIHEESGTQPRTEDDVLDLGELPKESFLTEQSSKEPAPVLPTPPQNLAADLPEFPEIEPEQPPAPQAAPSQVEKTMTGVPSPDDVFS
jgi:hypothetical protein